MAKEAGVVKSVNGGIARALNDLTGEVRQLSVGDIVYQGEKIVTEGSNSKVTITQTDGKEITLIGKDTLTLDQDSNNNETVADISALQQAILKGTDLNALEETAAGGPQAGGNGGDGVSLSSTSFAEGGHISNINANVGTIDALALAGAGDNALGVSGGSAVGAGAGATGPALPAGSIKIPLSAYTGEDISSGLLSSFHSSIPHGYHLYRHTDGRDYLTPDDPTAPSSFEYKEGWYVSNDGNLAIGQDNAKDLAVTSANQSSNYPDDNSVAKIVDPSQNLKVFGSDTPNNITVDNAKITSVHAGVGEDNIDAKNGAKLLGISGGSGSDGITVESGSFVNKLYGDNKTQNDIHEKRVHPDLDIEDKGAAADTIKVTGNGTQVNFIGAGDGDDTITVDKGAKVKLVLADEGNDNVTVSDSGTYVSAINGRGGDDTILVEKGAKVDGIVGRWGNDNITITGAGTVVTENVEGNEDGDTIKILDGARVQGYVSGGRGENPSTYGGAENSDGNKITIENATVKGNVEGSTYGGDNEIKISNSKIGGDVLGGKDKDKIDIDGGAERKGSIGGKIISGDGDDIVTIRNTNLDKVDNNYNKNVKVDTGTGNDTVNLYNVTVNDTNIWTKEGNDTVNATNTTFTTTQGTGIGTGSGNDVVNINSGSNFESGTHISAGEGNDIININSGANLNGGHVYGYAGNDTININSGATLTNSSVRGNEGNDTISISGGATINNSGSIAINGDEGNNTLVLKNGASAGFNNLNFENKVSITHTNGDVNITNMEGDKTVDLSQLSAITDKNVKSVDLMSINGAKLNITAEDVLDINKTTGDTLTVKGGIDDTVHKTDTSSWQNNNDGTYSTTVNGETVSIKIENNVTLDL
ncbi:retention module-containing protein [Campylobacter concisus]|uniref:Retention module-containing protein n=1 Tax=Campylobacter concisus TaxID=199 RepID=A0A7S9NDB0_9BACT|nr:retention module-containing protein [Campylobacter concisus]QPH83677.1 retention module-containing protein [Campylobacter concisus]